jgi:hypothetical protein
MRLRTMQHSGTHCVPFFGTRGRQGIRHPRSIYRVEPGTKVSNIGCNFLI